MDAAVAVFTKANPDIKVETTGYTGDQAGFTKVTQAVQGGGSGGHLPPAVGHPAAAGAG